MVEVRKRQPIPRGLIAFVLGYMVVCSAMAVRMKSVEFIAYAGMMVVFIGLVLFLNSKARFSHSTLWMLGVWGALHMFGGTVQIPAAWADTDTPRIVLYTLRIHPNLPRYDQLTHAFGFFTATLACWEALRHLTHARTGLALSAAAALMGMGLGAVNEVLEFFIALNVENNGVGGWKNTGWDLVSNAIGAILAGAWTLRRR
jgi:VanZ family protein